ncbi:Metallo-dependent phosphatase-like protein [Chlamydoabsidia padenii]|nr:Metallo-dependent phosphatase-like protein [Chlamydoabsidia padenii]
MQTIWLLFGCLVHSILVYCQEQQSNSTLTSSSNGLTGRFLHITDIHVDPNYLVGSSPKQHCHRKSDRAHKNTAGRFGALSTKCDSPLALVDASFKFMKESLQDIDFIIYTGDTARHDRDDELSRTETDVLEDHKTVVQFFKNAFNIPTIKLIPTIGNNDAVEHDNIMTTSSIYKSLETIWEPLQLSLNDTFPTGGYFMQNDIVPGLRIMNLNSMFFFNKNMAVQGCDRKDSPGAIQMAWIKEKLELAKKDKVMVYIMGHVPPYHDDGSPLFTPSCLSQYFHLIGMYGDIIAGHFTGHTNNDVLTAIVSNNNTFEAIPAIPDKNNLRTLNVGPVSTMLFNAPSIIPVNNPAIRVYHYETMEGKEHPVGTILDWDQYYVDLNKANRNGNVVYELEYRASQLYGVKRFDAQGISRAFKQLRVNTVARHNYTRYTTVSKF